MILVVYVRYIQIFLRNESLIQICERIVVLGLEHMYVEFGCGP